VERAVILALQLLNERFRRLAHESALYVYWGLGADIVYGIITLIDAQGIRSFHVEHVPHDKEESEKVSDHEPESAPSSLRLRPP